MCIVYVYTYIHTHETIRICIVYIYIYIHSTCIAAFVCISESR